MSYHGFNQAYISLRIEKYIFLYTCIHIHWAGHLVYHTPLQNLVATRQRLSTGALVMIRSIFGDDMLLHFVNDHHRYGRTWCMLLNEDSACMQPFPCTDSMLFYRDFFVHRQGYHRYRRTMWSVAPEKHDDSNLSRWPPAR